MQWAAAVAATARRRVRSPQPLCLSPTSSLLIPASPASCPSALLSQRQHSTAGAGGTPVRVRYAPSPTGFLHLGGLRTALYNYLFARKHGGTFILRIEDTDRTRLVEGSIAGLISALKWCGLDYDEGPMLVASSTQPAAHAHKHGPHCKHGSSASAPAPAPASPSSSSQLSQIGSFGPYIQSERLHIYRSHAEQLLEAGHAYRCFCSPERLAALREAQSKRGQNSLYDRACLKLNAAEAERRAQAGEPHTIRMKVPAGTATVQDVVLGEVKFQNGILDDQVLMKSDGFPTYHLASVVDDHSMQISHIIRGQEWLSSTPKHSLLYAAFGWQAPAFAHLPLLLNPDRSKLSKRHGDAAVEDFMEGGYLPEALLNFVALLGWTPPQGRELMSLQDMVALFDLSAINKSNAAVDRARLDFFSGEHLKALWPAATVGAGAGVAAGQKQQQQQQQQLLPAVPGRKEEVAARVLAAVQEELTMKGLDSAITVERDADARSAGAASSSSSPSAEQSFIHTVLAAQSHRVQKVHDFVPLTLPFLCNDAAFVALLKEALNAAPPASTAAAAVENSTQSAVAAGAAADETTSPSTSNKPASRKEAQLQQQKQQASARQLQSLSSRDIFLKVLQSSPADSLSSAVSSLCQEVQEGAAAAASGGQKQQLTQEQLKACAKAHGLNAGKFMLAVRFALSGLDVGPSMNELLQLLRADSIAVRLAAFRELLEQERRGAGSKPPHS